MARKRLRDRLPITHTPSCIYFGRNCNCPYGAIATKIFNEEVKGLLDSLIDSDWDDVYGKADSARVAVTQAKANYKQQLKSHLEEIVRGATHE